MSPQLFHLFGDISIHAYGLFIALGLTAASFLLYRDKPLQKIIVFDDLLSIISWCIIAGILGGRMLWMIETWPHHSWIEFFKLWTPGYSILGAMTTAVIALFILLSQATKQPFAVLDRLAIYAPLAQAIGRVGCFFTGCCYGAVTSLWCAVTYTHPDCLAPLGVPLHPTQLYSSVLGVTLFIFLYCTQKWWTKSGQLAGLYLIGAGLERFLVDFLRAPRRLIGDTIISRSQVLAAIVVVGGCVIFYVAWYAKRQHKHI